MSNILKEAPLPRTQSILKGVRHLSIEIGPRCNLSTQHDLCPSRDKSRFPTKQFGVINTNDILKVIADATDLGFAGYVGFHYFNEPLMYKDRIIDVIKNTKYKRFMLWTNGLLFNKDVKDNDIINLFEWIVITNYEPEKTSQFFGELVKAYPNTRIEYPTAGMDDRLYNYDKDFLYDNVNCWRPRIEVPIDSYGNVHLCCQDWKGQHHIGNIKENSFKEIMTSEKHKKTIFNLCGGNNPSPNICCSCSNTFNQSGYIGLCSGHIEPSDPRE